ncbi:MAG: hypothetical protein KDI13_10400 [Alphaproteobacteria bacterium]|nr:hypothetical protein [Alphaproteobacteria bacterium]
MIEISIAKDQIIPLLLDACPSFKVVYEGSDYQDSPYTIAGEFSDHLLMLYKQGNVIEFSRVAELIERLIVYGDSYTKEYAIVGILESVQNVWGQNSVDTRDFESILLPESQEYWQRLNDFWEGKIPFDG